MDIQDYTSNGRILQWSLQDGQARCVADAILPNDRGATAALQANAAVRALMVNIEMLEASAARAAQGPLDNGAPKTLPVLDTDGAPTYDAQRMPITTINPLWALLPQDQQGSYTAALGVMSAASVVAKALVKLRAGDTTAKATVVDEFNRLAAVTLATTQSTLAATKVTTNATMMDFMNAITDQITKSYPSAEVDTWQTQLAEARTVIAGGTLPDGALLPMLVAARGAIAVSAVTQAALTLIAQQVIAKSAAYYKIVAAVQVLRIQGQAGIAAANSLADLDDAMTSLKATGLAAAHQMGLA